MSALVSLEILSASYDIRRCKVWLIAAADFRNTHHQLM
jgi:hypothetical protein